MRVVSSAPARIDLAGGTIDLWPLYLLHQGAQTLNAAITLRAHCTIQSRADDRITLVSEDTRERVEAATAADLDLDRLRVAVAGGAALQYVRNKHIRTLLSNLPEQLLQQFARASDERDALLVLARPRSLPHEHQLRVGVAGPEDDGLARRGQLGTARTAARLREDLLERLAPLGCR